ncbi:MAG: hypothetical protein ABL984_05385 [Pyrinomonadaceae bacterium]
MNKPSGQIEIDPNIRLMRHILLYAKPGELLYRPVDSVKKADMTPEFAFEILLGTARDILAHAKISGCMIADGMKIHVTNGFIFRGEAVVTGFVFEIREREMVFDRDQALITVRNQLGRVWN